MKLSILYTFLCTFDITGGTSEDYDYYPEPYSVTIPAGRTKVSFHVEIFDDNIVENNETFQLYISGTNQDTAHISSPNSTMITIVDDNCKHYVHAYVCVYLILHNNCYYHVYVRMYT